MDFMNIPNTYHPAYTWLWNSTITRQGIREQLEEMYHAGIRAFYAIGEPENFRPKIRRTHLSPEYLSDEYLDLLFYAHETGKAMGMHMWLYNEGGFPSGMACGQIRQVHPELAMKELIPAKLTLEAGTPYIPHSSTAAAFLGVTRILPGQAFNTAAEITEYRICPESWSGIRTDNASKRNTEIFLQQTHERMKNRFGDAMGTDITLMFDDEANMGTWTEGFDRIFREKYGYDILEYLPWIIGDFPPETDKQYRARSDYFMLCGDLVRDNYFTPMKQWLRQHNMRSTGHLDNDHRADGNVVNRYGNALQTLREFDVPGIDVIWEQIGYPKSGSPCPEGMPFFPRMASSAARQLGHSTAVSESFAVYGSHVDPELMRFVVNYQAVRGISLFNFMVVSYDRKTPMSLQYRPNFNSSNPSMDRLSQINTYTARLSQILQENKADITTALYYPARSICAGGDKGKSAMDSFVRLGEELEAKGVSFDIVDEELVQNAAVSSGILDCKTVSYQNVFLPEVPFEPESVIKKLSTVGRSIEPCVLRVNRFLQARKLLFPQGSEGYFICNTGGETVSDVIGILSNKKLYRLDLLYGTLYDVEHNREDGIYRIPVTLLRGEGVFFVLTEKALDAHKSCKAELAGTLEDFRSYVSRSCQLNHENAVTSTYSEPAFLRSGLYQWDPDFSGEVTYLCRLPSLAEGSYILDLGEVRSTARIYLEGEKLAETTLPPHRIPVSSSIQGKELKIVVANTLANACAHTDYFAKHHPADVGPYHAKMVLQEAAQPGGGLLGPVRIYKEV